LKESIVRSIQESIAVSELLKSEAERIATAAEMIIESIRSDGKIILFGNGGSAADAQHIAAELTGKYLLQRRPLPAIALTVNTPAITAIGNDYGFDHVFQRQVNALCNRTDVIVAISTSGNSRNVILGVEASRTKGVRSIALTGKSGGSLARLVDLAIRVPSESTPRIQESHLLIGHIISEVVERTFAKESYPEEQQHIVQPTP
jgi:D-sedoheptulose 7-phosphate isomerase